MKKIKILCLFAFTFVLGAQTLAAQSSVEINAFASEKTQELKNFIEFNNDTAELVYKAYQELELKKQSIIKIEADGRSVSNDDKKKLESMLSEKFRDIFTVEQFTRYLTFVDKQK